MAGGKGGHEKPKGKLVEYTIKFQEKGCWRTGDIRCPATGDCSVGGGEGRLSDTAENGLCRTEEDFPGSSTVKCKVIPG